MLGALLGLCVIGGAAIKVCSENAYWSTHPVDQQNGNPVTLDRHCQRNICGEPTTIKIECDEFGNCHTREIGRKTGRIYFDDFDKKITQWTRKNEAAKQQAIEEGKTVYEVYDWRLDTNVCVEMSTGKKICALYGDDDKGLYRKWYLPERIYNIHPEFFQQGWDTDARRFLNCNLGKEEENDWGIPITKEEYETLRRQGDIRSLQNPSTKKFCGIGKPGDPFYKAGEE